MGEPVQEQHELTANQVGAGSTDMCVELHEGLCQAGLILLPEGHHGVITQPLGCLHLHSRILGIM